MNNSPLISLFLLNYIEMYDNNYKYETFFYKGKQYFIISDGEIPYKYQMLYTNPIFLFYNDIQCLQNLHN